MKIIEVRYCLALFLMIYVNTSKGGEDNAGSSSRKSSGFAAENLTKNAVDSTNTNGSADQARYIDDFLGGSAKISPSTSLAKVTNSNASLAVRARHFLNYIEKSATETPLKEFCEDLIKKKLDDRIVFFDAKSDGHKTLLDVDHGIIASKKAIGFSLFEKEFRRPIILGVVILKTPCIESGRNCTELLGDKNQGLIIDRVVIGQEVDIAGRLFSCGAISGDEFIQIALMKLPLRPGSR